MLVAVSFLGNLHYPFSTEFNFVADSQVINQFIFRHLVISHSVHFGGSAASTCIN